MKKLSGIILIFALAVVLQAPFVSTAYAASTDTASILESIKTLMAKIADLQKQVSEAKTEVSAFRESLKENLKEGMTDEDIKKVQELLASDPSIYPEGLKTGYFGSLTKSALKRFQSKHGIRESGEIDSDTKELLDEYMHHKFGESAPRGVLRAPGIIKKVQDDICLKSRRVASGLFCKDYDYKESHYGNDCGRSLANVCGKPTSCQISGNVIGCRGSSTDDSEYDVVVTIISGITKVTFTFEDEDYEVSASSTRSTVILAAVAEELDVTVRRLDSKLAKEIKSKLSKTIKDKVMSNVSKDTALRYVGYAEKAIAKTQSNIDDADDDVDTSDAEDLLDEANDLLDEAQAAYDAENYSTAKSKAREAQAKAHDADEKL